MDNRPERVTPTTIVNLDLTVPADDRFRGTVHDLAVMVAEHVGFASEMAGGIGDAVDQVVEGVVRHAFGGRPGHSIGVRFRSNNAHLEIGISYADSPDTASSMDALQRELTDSTPAPDSVSVMTLVRRVTERVEFGRDGDRYFCRFVCRLPGGGS